MCACARVRPALRLYPGLERSTASGWMARGGAGRAVALGLALRLLLLLGLGLEVAPAPALAPTQVPVSGIEPCAQKGQCQPLATLPCSCDNISGCPAGSDKNLLNCSRQPCQEGELRCMLDDVCIPHTWRCDGHPDCPDSSDELSCDTNIETDKIFQEENATTTRTPMTLENETSLRNATVASAGNPSRNTNAYGVIAAAGVLSAILVCVTILILLRLRGQGYLSPPGLLVAVKESLLLSERKTSLI
ncbi:CD320 antigen isoform X2 [Onychomys torridus]|uniref:CD320 antigen isoform X2 n=1 Tax=Onychomys torridus TaxID=38674 RepID=UPI00167F2E30|nr:CD320 antigen isoform X2 [Onychomys torridus]